MAYLRRYGKGIFNSYIAGYHRYGDLRFSCAMGFLDLWKRPA